MDVSGACLVGEEFKNALEQVNDLPSWISWFPTSSELADHLRKESPEGYAILIKGSRSQKMETVLEAL